MDKIKGFLYGIITSATFGLIPLFVLPVMAKGVRYESILFYRFLLASIVMAILMKIRQEDFRINRKDVPALFLLGLFYFISATFLFWGYSFMAAGIATTLHFTYPIFVTLVMLLFFKEKASGIILFAILLAICGVARLSISEGDNQITLAGILLVLISAVGYALYIVTVNKSRISQLSGRKITLYVFIINTFLFMIKAMAGAGIQPIPDPASGLNLFLLAVIPTVVSNITLIKAVQAIGGTLTSILGATEPVTAVLVGVLIFHEPFPFNIGLGILLIIIAVGLIILSKVIHKTLKSIRNKLVSHARVP
ncbi:MAG: DMT family transporter [Tannerellaceae bacterium]|nr:DMT family transporter [Tannerellaceae bacterium]